MQRMLSYMRKAIENYNMIEEGDKIAVGLSGGRRPAGCGRRVDRGPRARRGFRQDQDAVQPGCGRRSAGNQRR